MRARLKVSRAGIELIKSFEGLRQTATRLPDGRWTLGYGHTFSAREGARVTQEDADALLRFDLLPIVDAVNNLVLVPLNQNQFDALVSFCFNIGVDNFAVSTVLKRLNEGKPAEAAQAMDAWHLNPTDVVNSLHAMNRNDPAGQVKGVNRVWLVRSASEAKDPTSSPTEVARAANSTTSAVAPSGSPQWTPKPSHPITTMRSDWVSEKANLDRPMPRSTAPGVFGVESWRRSTPDLRSLARIVLTAKVLMNTNSTRLDGAVALSCMAFPGR